jgi:hypothetical protein
MLQRFRVLILAAGLDVQTEVFVVNLSPFRQMLMWLFAKIRSLSVFISLLTVILSFNILLWMIL